MLEGDAEKEQLPLFHCLSSIKEGKIHICYCLLQLLCPQKTPKTIVQNRNALKWLKFFL